MTKISLFVSRYSVKLWSKIKTERNCQKPKNESKTLKQRNVKSL